MTITHAHTPFTLSLHALSLPYTHKPLSPLSLLHTHTIHSHTLTSQETVFLEE